MLDALDAVTAEDVQRVAKEILDSGFHLAVIGPFDDAARFEKLLGSFGAVLPSSALAGTVPVRLVDETGSGF